VIFALVLAFYLPTWYDEYKSSRSRKMMEALTSKCPIPEEGVNICCYEGGVMSLCNNKDSFKCGERIELRIRLKK
jgi:hypothetical protein